MNFVVMSIIGKFSIYCMVVKHPLANDTLKTNDNFVLFIVSKGKKIAKNKGNKKSKTSKTHPLLKGNGGGAQASTSKRSKEKSPNFNTECFYCHENGYFKRDCPKYKST